MAVESRLIDQEESAIRSRFAVSDDHFFDVLRDHRDIGLLLEQLADRVPRYFDQISRLVIESSYDAEDADESWYVVIETTMSPINAVEGLKRFDHEWWLMVQAAASLEVTATIGLV